MQREKKKHITFLNSVFILWDIVEMSTILTIVVVFYAKHINGGCDRTAPSPHLYEAFQSNTLIFSSIWLTRNDIITMLVKSEFFAFFCSLCLAHIGSNSKEAKCHKIRSVHTIGHTAKADQKLTMKNQICKQLSWFYCTKTKLTNRPTVRNSKTVVAKRSLYCQLN